MEDEGAAGGDEGAYSQADRQLVVDPASGGTPSGSPQMLSRVICAAALRLLGREWWRVADLWLAAGSSVGLLPLETPESSGPEPTAHDWMTSRSHKG